MCSMSRSRVSIRRRDYILSTILSNYSEDASVLLSTHLIADVERVLDEVIFLGGRRDGAARYG